MQDEIKKQTRSGTHVKQEDEEKFSLAGKGVKGKGKKYTGPIESISKGPKGRKTHPK